MDVSLLSAMISELITGHDQVGLPGLGTFVAEVVPATFSDKGYTINPPYRRLSFHPGSSEDRLLIDLYAASNGISKEAAGVYVRQFLSEMKSALKERKAIVLPGLGRLRATVENNFFFVADPDLDIYPDGFALKPLSLKAMTDFEPQPQPESEPQPQPEPEPEPEPKAEPIQESEPQSEPKAESKPQPAGHRGRFRWWMLLLILLALLAVALLAFLTVAQVAPDLMDSILYTPEELRIINY